MKCALMFTGLISLLLLQVTTSSDSTTASSISIDDVQLRGSNDKEFSRKIISKPLQTESSSLPSSHHVVSLEPEFEEQHSAEEEESEYASPPDTPIPVAITDANTSRELGRYGRRGSRSGGRGKGGSSSSTSSRSRRRGRGKGGKGGSSSSSSKSRSNHHRHSRSRHGKGGSGSSSSRSRRGGGGKGRGKGRRRRSW